jgi:hypothetical protein
MHAKKQQKILITQGVDRAPANPRFPLSRKYIIRTKGATEVLWRKGPMQIDYTIKVRVEKLNFAMKP